MLKARQIFFLLAQTLGLAIIFFTPLYFSWFWPLANIFILPKVVLFRVLAVFLLWAVLADCFLGNGDYNNQRIEPKTKAPFFKKTEKEKFAFVYFFLCLLFFLLSLIIATLVSVDVQTSFFGSYARQQGLVSYLFYFLFFILLLYILRGKKDIILALKTAVVAAFLVCFYGWAQVAGFDPLPWSEPFFSSGRLASTLGQPNFFASWLLLIVPLTFYFWRQGANIASRLFWLIILVVQLSCLFLTYSRAGWLGLVVGLAAVGAVWLKKEKKRKSGWWFLKIGLVGGLVGIVFLMGLGWSLKNINDNVFVKKRLLSFVHWQKGSWPARLTLWSASWPAIKKRPWWGYGLDNQGEALLPYYSQEMSVHTGINIYPDRAHNIILDLWLMAGLAGVLSFLGLLWFLFRLLIKNICQANNKQALFYALLAGLSGYLFSLLFGFSSFTTNLYFWFYLAVIVSLSADMSTKTACQNFSFKFKRGLIFNFLIILLLFVGAIVFGLRQGRITTADYYWRQIQEADNKNDVASALNFYQHLKEISNYNYYYEQTGNIFANWSLEGYDFLFFSPLQEINSKIKPHSLLARLYKAEVLTALSRAKEKGAFSLAEKEFNILFAKVSNFPHFYYQAGRLQLKAKKYNQARRYFQTALQLLPAENDQRLSREHLAQIKQEKYLLYQELARLSWRQKNFSLALKFYNLAFINNPAKISILSKMAQAAYFNNDINQAIWYTKMGWRRQPENYFWPQNLALLYKKMGNLGKEKEYSTIVQNLKSNLRSSR